MTKTNNQKTAPGVISTHRLGVEIDDQEFRLRVKKMATEVIILSLRDIEKKPNGDKSNSASIIRNKECAIRWFNERSVDPFGYGWCLEYSELNPNLVRKIINRFLGA